MEPDTPIPADLELRMRAGARAAAKRAAATVRSSAGPTAPALLCAGACAPVLAAAAGADRAAALDAWSAIGGALADIVAEVADRRLERPEADLAERFDDLLETDAAVRRAIAAVLERTRAAAAAAEAVVDADNGDQFAELRDLGERHPEFARFADAFTAETARRLAGDGPANARIDRIGRRILDGGTGGRTRSATAGLHGACPYVGLTHYDEDRRSVYFGRERVLDDLRWRVVARMTSGGALIVTGAPGVGKSSLLRAGLLSDLAANRFPVEGADAWPRLVMTPGRRPMAALAAELAALDDSATEPVRRALEADPESAYDLVNERIPAAAGDAPMRLLLVVDQFEELFTLAPSAERRPFVAALHSIAGDGPAGVAGIVVLGLRGDFHDRCTAFRELIAPLQNNLVVPPMTADEMRLAITAPAASTGLELDSGLADEILDQLRGTGEDGEFGTSALPLLAQTMRLLWQRREGDRLTRGALASFGGTAAAIETAAEEVYRRLDPRRQAAAQDLFRRMTAPAADGRPVRIPLDHDMIAALTEEHREALNRFAEARLIIRTRSSAAIASDALLTRWPRLHEWTKPN